MLHGETWGPIFTPLRCVRTPHIFAPVGGDLYDVAFRKIGLRGRAPSHLVTALPPKSFHLSDVLRLRLPNGTLLYFNSALPLGPLKPENPISSL